MRCLFEGSRSGFMRLSWARASATDMPCAGCVSIAFNLTSASAGADGTARVVEMWSARTAALGSRADVSYVFLFENQGRATGATIDHPHSQIMAFAAIPPLAVAELAKGPWL